MLPSFAPRYGLGVLPVAADHWNWRKK